MKTSQLKKARIPTGSAVVPSRVSNESLRKYEQDIETLTKRISDMNGSTQPENSAFVSGLRTSVEINRGGENEGCKIELQTVQDLLSRVIELDRLVLKRTDDAIKARSRRGSRGSDLFTIPTHLLLVDRLMDLYTISQRPTIIQSQNSAPVMTPSYPDLSEELAARKAEVTRLSKNLADSESAKTKLQDMLGKKVAEIDTLKAQHKTQLQQARAPQDTRSRSPRSPRPSQNLSIVGNGANTPVTAPSAPVVDPSVIAKLEKENTELKAKLALSEQTRQSLEERCEIAAAMHQSSLVALNSLTDRFKESNIDISSISLIEGSALGVVRIVIYSCFLLS